MKPIDDLPGNQITIANSSTRHSESGFAHNIKTFFENIGKHLKKVFSTGFDIEKEDVLRFNDPLFKDQWYLVRKLMNSSMGCLSHYFCLSALKYYLFTLLVGLGLSFGRTSDYMVGLPNVYEPKLVIEK